MSAQMQRGDDCLTTFLGGMIALVIVGSLLILLLSWLFND
jgi:hypothetical protein